MSTPPGSKLALLIPRDQVAPVRASVGALEGCNAISIQLHNHTNEHIATITVAALPNTPTGQLDYVEGYCRQGDEMRVFGYAAPLSEEYWAYADRQIGILDVERVHAMGRQPVPTQAERDREQMSEVLAALKRIENRVRPPFPGYPGTQTGKLAEIVAAFIDGIDLKSDSRDAAIEKAVRGILELAVLRVRDDFAQTVDDGS